MATEFDLIEHYFKPLSTGLCDDEVGIGDDGAVLNAVDKHQLVVVTDTLVSGVHFPKETCAYDIAWKALAVNLSDLAAMGAKPAFFSLALTLPYSDEAWLKEFAKGLADLAKVFKVPLIGGDTTKGPLTITVSAQGWVPTGQALMRSGAKQGDLICVTNTLGDAALGLKFALKTIDENHGLSEQDVAQVLEALNRPMPQLTMIKLLQDYATSAIDVSDGLLADLGHILEATNAKRALDNQVTNPGEVVKPALKAKLDLDRLPLSLAVAQYVQQQGCWSTVLAGGDDYELCFTVAATDFVEMRSLADKLGVQLTAIGVCELTEDKPCIEVYKGDKLADEDVIGEVKGYLHF